MAAALFLLAVGGTFYLPYISELPSGIHAWAQADRLALATNFYDFGFDFFKPRTSNLSSIGGVTGVEFPLQAYLAALGGLLFGRASIGTLFRLLDVSMTLLGFYYLFRLVYERTGNFVAGLVPGAFLLASPVFAFYAGSTLPDPFSLSLSFVAYYYWLRFFDQRRFSDLLVACALLGVAALIKTTTLMHLGAMAGVTLLWALLQPQLLTLRQRLSFLGLMAVIFGVIVAYFLRTQYLNATYQSGMFLATVRPIDDPQTRHHVLKAVYYMWRYEYAVSLQYKIIILCLCLLPLYWRRNLKPDFNLPLTLLLLAVTGMGCLFVYLMGAQFRDHDYYIICPVFAPVILLFVLALRNLGQHTGLLGYGIRLGLAVLVCVSLVNGHQRLKRRMSDDYPPFSPYSHLWMRGGAAELAQAKVPATAKILVFNEPAPNIALVYFDRRGIIWHSPDVATVTAENVLDRMAADNLDYFVVAPQVYAQLAPQHAVFEAEFELVGRHPAIVLHRLNRSRPW
ncbi:ArnT family glycosyltransferase [Hymenobacter arizonensis]|uniref:ArnT family glycosyltransferase n=1 Tax=Hymenobacter arizonensis TaxID=1227077 RepID=UPI0015A68360|nr:glycosyltransferase family 39 protein [Hymenobacter arizonensis]